MADQSYLGIECGGTRTVALLADARGRQLDRVVSGPANLQLLSDPQLMRHFRAIAKQLPRPTALGIGMAGMRTEADRRRVLAATTEIWARVPCVVTNDLETALAAAPSAHGDVTRVLVLSGTGSCCYGKNVRGRVAKVGGWGHLLGDGGSGYDIGLRALKFVLTQFDHSGELPPLGRRFLRVLQLNEPNEFILWAQSAGKADIAALAKEVFDAAARKDQLAGHVLQRSTIPLVHDALACARRLARPGEPVEFVLAGSNLHKQPSFAAAVAGQIAKDWPRAIITKLERESAWGAVELAMQATGRWRMEDRKSKTSNTELRTPNSELSPTELRHPRSMKLDKLPTAKTIELMLSEDEKIPAALRAERKHIERAIGWIVSALRRDGGLFYVGAGTSGRLGILDASECPPTFRASPEMVQGIIAGGQRAIWSAVEGAEDDAAAGARAIQFRGVGKRDVVVGIAASGRTPFVLAALTEAKQRGAKTVLLCFNPHVRKTAVARQHLVIAPDIGPEILTGSTRLKAGTATKLVLNMFTTLAMVRLGKVVGNLMVDLNPSNVKLRDRAVRIVKELTEADDATAQQLLEKSGWVVTDALARFKPTGRNRKPLPSRTKRGTAAPEGRARKTPPAR